MDAVSGFQLVVPCLWTRRFPIRSVLVIRWSELVSDSLLVSLSFKKTISLCSLGVIGFGDGYGRWIMVSVLSAFMLVLYWLWFCGCRLGGLVLG